MNLSLLGKLYWWAFTQLCDTNEKIMWRMQDNIKLWVVHNLPLSENDSEIIGERLRDGL